MKTIALIACTVFAFACSRESPPPAAQADPTRYDLEFIDTLARHHELTIKVANAAATNATHPELASLARQLVATGSGELTQLQSWRDRWYAGAPKAYGAKLPGALALDRAIAAPQGPPSHRWDIDTVRILRELQQAAAAMSEEAARKATRPEVRAFAAEHGPSHRRAAASFAEWETSWVAHEDTSTH